MSFSFTFSAEWGGLLYAGIHLCQIIMSRCFGFVCGKFNSVCHRERTQDDDRKLLNLSADNIFDSSGIFLCVGKMLVSLNLTFIYNHLPKSML